MCNLFAAANAGEINSVVVKKTGRIYKMSIDALIDAPRPSVFAALTNYDELTAISPAIIESRELLEYSPLRHRMRMVTRLCVLFFCSSIRQTQDMEQLANGDLTATIVPEDSNLHGGDARWRLTPRDEATTHLLFDATLEPAFWIPPVIGSALVSHMLTREAERTVEGLELIYQQERKIQ